MSDARFEAAIPRWALAIVAVVTIYKLFVASHIPLNEDEAYFWVWSLHPDFGYTDHPPMVAWLLWLGSVFGTSPLALRLPFIACTVIAAIAIGRATILLSGNAQAGGVAATILTLVPGPFWTVPLARPDPPYICFWALALWLIVSAERRPTVAKFALLGAAMGGAILSRFFGWALVLGIVLYAIAPARRALWRNGLWLSLAVAGALYVPFILWNAAHDWEAVKFAAYTRQSLIPYFREPAPIFLTLRFYVLAAAFVGVSWFVTIRRGHALIAWTALPFVAVLAVVSFFQTVESVWLRGPFTSLVVALGDAYTRLGARWRGFWKVTGGLVAAFSMATFFVIALPEGAQSWVQSALTRPFGDPFYDGVYTYRPLTRDVRAMTEGAGVTVLTDRYEVASELIYNGAAAPIIIGPVPQVPQWRRWYDPSSTVPMHALLVSSRPLSANPEIDRRLRAAYGRVISTGVLTYAFAGRRAGTFYMATCELPRLGAATALFGG